MRSLLSLQQDIAESAALCAALAAAAAPFATSNALLAVLDALRASDAALLIFASTAASCSGLTDAQADSEPIATPSKPALSASENDFCMIICLLMDVIFVPSAEFSYLLQNNGLFRAQSQLSNL
jgi:hypothetical protein